MAALKNALPGHLKSALGGSSGEAEFAKKHHGKTQSHMVSGVFFVYHRRAADSLQTWETFADIRPRSKVNS